MRAAVPDQPAIRCDGNTFHTIMYGNVHDPERVQDIISYRTSDSRHRDIDWMQTLVISSATVSGGDDVVIKSCRPGNPEFHPICKWPIELRASRKRDAMPLGLWKRVQVSRPPSKPNLIDDRYIYIPRSPNPENWYIYIPRSPNPENCENPNMEILMYGSN